ncbi:OsmC family protein [Microbacterium amylolyticum]|uniref:Organic hydroperoxide reductase OsmC/OhrA n=1 Tax=Microbacterium amylolyticum TaxID=936337 RepID=A0ABS4ZG83_9MICO|nr:OsmC family protein [Microbacterium amylolyticum]MBP2436232.1 organic hydroperoxide reductase OsmC/OhrA [Microbacterium amylolyticum]
MSIHRYAVTTEWTGNHGSGTSGYREYARDVTVQVEGKPDILASADRPFRGDPARWNPEDFLMSALSECHLLSYLHACVTRSVVVTEYTDHAEGEMEISGNGGRFRSVILRPQVRVADEGMIEEAMAAHHDAHEWCFIANSVNFEIRVEPTITA